MCNFLSPSVLKEKYSNIFDSSMIFFTFFYNFSPVKNHPIFPKKFDKQKARFSSHTQQCDYDYVFISISYRYL